MVEQTGSTSLVKIKREPLSQEQRIDYTQSIMPFVDAAKKAYAPVASHRKQLKFIKEEEIRVQNQIKQTPQVDDLAHPLHAALVVFNMSKKTLEKDEDIVNAKEQFRLKVNELIIQVNKWKSENSTSFSIRPQIAQAEKRNKFTKPDSPVRPHNALGTLSIYRENKVQAPLVISIRKHAATLIESSSLASEVSLAMVSLLPNHFISANRSTPTDLRNPNELGREIVLISQMVGLYDAGILQPPSAEELGSPGPGQEKHLITHLRALLGHFLRGELTNPNRTEKELQDHYQDLSNYVRKAANHITPQYGNINDSYERVGLAIEKMPGIEGSMLSSRLSTKLFQDLGLPCLEYMGENRLAEVLRNIGSGGHFAKSSKVDQTLGGYKITSKERHQFEKIIESISSRLENDEIDCHKIFEALENLDYGETLMDHLLQIADNSSRSILLRALAETNCFPDFKRTKLKEDQDDDFDEFD